VLVIDENGQKLGEFMTQDAVRLAEERGLDLVEVAPNGRPPVCRITDYGQMKYEKKKKEAAARKNQIQQQLKEVKVRPKTDDHDMEVKVKHAKRFLEEGNKVKVTVRFRGREMAHREIGAEQCNRVAQAVGDLGLVESPPRMEGRNTMFMIIAPTRKPVKKKQDSTTDGPPPEELEDDLDDDLDDDEDDDLDDDDDDDDDDEEGPEEGAEAPAAEARAADEAKPS
jgi:translation initiation factor IF-3